MSAKVLKNSLVILLPVGMLVLVTALSLLPPDHLRDKAGWFRQIPHSDKIVHFFFYFFLVSAIRFAKTYFTGFPKACVWKLLVMAAAYGGAIELLQGAYFGRGCELWDEIANILGAASAIWLVPQNRYEKTAQKIKGGKK